MFLPAFITATLTAFFCGILLKFGYVSLISVWLAIVFGDLISNIFWYFAGRIGGALFISSFGKIFKLSHEDLVGSLNIFDKFKDYLAFFVSAPIGIAIMIIGLMNAGLQKHSFGKFIITNTIGSMVWIGLILSLGYSVGYLLVEYSSTFSRISTSVAALFILFILLTLGAWFRSRIVATIG